MMMKLSILLRISWQAFMNNIRHGTTTRRKWLEQFFGLSVLAVVLYLAGNASFRYAFEKSSGEFDILAFQLINLFMSIGMLMVLKDGMEQSLKLLYEQEDVLLLMSSPVTSASILGYKLISLISANMVSMLIWLAPPWLALGRIFQASWGFYLVLFPTLVLFLVILQAPILISVILIARLVSSWRIMRALKILGAGLSLLVGIGMAMFIMRGVVDAEQLVAFLSKLRPPMGNWYPHIWVSKFLVGYLPSIQDETWRWGILLLGASILVCAGTLLLGTLIYFRSWELSRQVAMPARKRTQAKPFTVSLLTRGRKRAIMRKDLRVFLSNSRQLMVLIMLTGVILLTLFGFLHDGEGNSRDIKELLLVSCGMIVCYSFIVTNSLTWGAFKSEGKMWWLLQISPISPAMLLNAKLLFGLGAAVLYTEALMIFTLVLLQIPLQFWFSAFVGAGAMAAEIAALNTAAGSLPWIAEIGPGQNMQNPLARAITMLFTLFLSLGLLFVTLVLIGLMWGREILANLPYFLAQLLVFGGLGLIYLSVFLGCYSVAKRSLAKLLLVN